MVSGERWALGGEVCLSFAPTVAGIQGGTGFFTRLVSVLGF